MAGQESVRHPHTRLFFELVTMAAAAVICVLLSADVSADLESLKWRPAFATPVVTYGHREYDPIVSQDYGRWGLQVMDRTDPSVFDPGRPTPRRDTFRYHRLLWKK